MKIKTKNCTGKSSKLRPKQKLYDYVFSLGSKIHSASVKYEYVYFWWDLYVI